jgi:hypothetical protein
MGSFRLLREGEAQFELSYTNWFSSRAETSYGGQDIALKSKNIWMSKFDIFKNGVDCGDIIFNWMGHVIIRLTRADGAGEDEFLLKHRGILSTQYELHDASKSHLLTLKAGFNWSKFKYNYTVTQENHDFPQEVLDELLIYCGFAANLHMSRSGMS